MSFVMGPARVALVAVGTGKPISAATERRLIGLLYSRAIFSLAKLALPPLKEKKVNVLVIR
jgi:hypothetical protein